MGYLALFCCMLFYSMSHISTVSILSPLSHYPTNLNLSLTSWVIIFSVYSPSLLKVLCLSGVLQCFWLKSAILFRFGDCKACEWCSETHGIILSGKRQVKLCPAHTDGQPSNIVNAFVTGKDSNTRADMHHPRSGTSDCLLRSRPPLESKSCSWMPLNLQVLMPTLLGEVFLFQYPLSCTKPVLFSFLFSYTQL